MSFPHVQLSSFYFIYFALLGALIPFWSLYLESFHFEPVVIGVLVAILHGTRMVAANFWGWLADSKNQHLEIVRLGSLVTALIFVFIFWQESAWGIALVTLGFSFFFNAIIPQFEVVNLMHLGANKDRYGQVRLWGSIGFILSVMLLGLLFDVINIRWLPVLALILMVLMYINALWIPKPPVTKNLNEDKTHFLRIFLQTKVWVFFVICFLVQFSHGAYYAFYSLLLEELGYGRTAIGLLWSLGVLAEVIIFMFMHKLIRLFGLRYLMLISLVLSACRWWLIGYASDSLFWLIIAQLLHAFSFGALHSIAVALINQYFNASTQGQGQALYSCLGFGAGGALGAVLSGVLWADFGSGLTFGLAATAMLLSVVLAWFWIKPKGI